MSRHKNAKVHPIHPETKRPAAQRPLPDENSSTANYPATPDARSSKDQDANAQQAAAPQVDPAAGAVVAPVADGADPMVPRSSDEEADRPRFVAPGERPPKRGAARH